MTRATGSRTHRNCSFCGHDLNHPVPCPEQIQTGTDKTKKTPIWEPCPCARHHHRKDAHR